MSRYRIERAGAPSHYLPGWVVYNENNEGKRFPTWRRAINWANRQVAIEGIQQQTRMLEIYRRYRRQEAS